MSKTILELKQEMDEMVDKEVANYQLVIYELELDIKEQEKIIKEYKQKINDVLISAGRQPLMSPEERILEARKQHRQVLESRK